MPGMRAVAPTGARHEVGEDELFFSTTDAKGVIEQANSIFVRMSRFSREELVGAPHNIVRHPSMPGGAFLLMWQTLQAGLPFCAYVDNLAADGSTYGVFATMTPLGDGYLSVRGRPFQDALHDAVFQLYQQVRPLELAARDRGVSAHEAAVLGLDKLAELLPQAGFPSYDEFIWTALPAEVEERLRRSAGTPRRPEASGPLAEMLAASGEIEDELRGWASRLDDLKAVADRLLEAAPRLRETAEDNRVTADRLLAEDTGAFATAKIYLRVWTELAPEVSEGVDALVGELEELRRSCARTRFRIALAVLHDLALGQFVAEIIDDVPGSDQARPAIIDLCRALEEGVEETAAQAARNAELAGMAADRITQLGEVLGLPQLLIREWLIKADRSDESFDAIAEQMVARLDQTEAAIQILESLSVECRRIAVPLDVGVVETQVERLRRLHAFV